MGLRKCYKIVVCGGGKELVNGGIFIAAGLCPFGERGEVFRCCSVDSMKHA